MQTSLLNTALSLSVHLITSDRTTFTLYSWIVKESAIICWPFTVFLVYLQWYERTSGKSGFSHDHELFLRIRHYDSWNVFFCTWNVVLQIAKTTSIFKVQCKTVKHFFTTKSPCLISCSRLVGWLVRISVTFSFFIVPKSLSSFSFFIVPKLVISFYLFIVLSIIYYLVPFSLW